MADTAVRSGAPLVLGRRTCPGKIVWLTTTGRDVGTCTLTSGHRGDHRDAAGYAWNDERWLE